MAQKQFSIMICQPPEKVFRLLTDLPGYHQWLKPSTLFRQVMDISENPVRLGTTYTDHGTSSRMHGKVTEFDPPRLLTFLQSSRAWGSEMTIQIRYTLTPAQGETQVTRTYDFHVNGPLRLFQPVVLRSINRENERILQAMKSYLESD